MTNVWLVWHVYEQEDGHDEAKLIGVFSSREKAEEAVAASAHLPGFVDEGAFEIDESVVDRRSWIAGYVKV